MSNRYKGGVISATPPTTTGGESGTASGAWTLEQQMQAQGAGNWPIQPLPKYIEDVFSTWLYTGTGAAQTITNGIDTATYGAMVWSKSRSNAISNIVVDSVRGGTNALITNSTDANSADPGFHISSFNSNGYSLQGAGGGDNASGYTYVSWTFRKQAKFFDIVTYTGTGSVQNIPHNLGSVPGCIIVKSTTATEWWAVQHQSLGATKSLYLNATNAAETSPTNWNNTSPTSTQFTVGTNTPTNLSGATYVAYLFAHNAGGFGLTGMDNVISCGSVLGGAEVNLGYEPQWVLAKASGLAANWFILDTMRGFTGDTVGSAQVLRPNESSAESTNNRGYITSTGFVIKEVNGADYIYIAIRRGPMKVPTDGTSVFAPVIGNSSSSAPFMGWNTSFTVDGAIYQARAGSTGYEESRLQGSGRYLQTSSTAAEVSGGASQWDRQTGLGLTSNINVSDYIGWMYRRAPSVFDVVCYTGTGAAMTVPHNLGVAPELIILKSRNNAESWMVYAAPLGNAQWLALNSTFEASSAGLRWNDTTPTSSVFSVGKFSGTTPWSSGAGYTYVAYLFASCPGVSKVGSVTHVEPTTVVCGFIPRFVMIKSTTATGTDDWFVFDSARGLVPGNDPYLRLNSTGAENTPFGAADFVDVTSDGFIMNGFGGGNYIFLAIA